MREATAVLSSRQISAEVLWAEANSPLLAWKLTIELTTPGTTRMYYRAQRKNTMATRASYG